MTRIAVTGLGLHTSLGRGVPENWRRVLNPEPSLQPSVGLKGFDRARELAFSSVQEAFGQSGLWSTTDGLQGNAERLGCTFSASKPLFTNDDNLLPPDAVSDAVRHAFGLQGESRTVVAACATGAYSVALAASWIDQGLCDVVLAGSVEPLPHPLMAAGFRQLGVLSDDMVMRPFDRERKGFVFGEGAGAIVLESESHARARGAQPLAWLSGWACGADAHSAVAFNSGGQRIADVVRKALLKGNLPPTAIGHVNAHGTATRLNDALETQALHKAFGPHAKRLKVSATKSATGHLLGAAGSVELALTILALQHQMIPPTAHLTTADPACDLDYTPTRAMPATFDHALSVSFGFGGPIGALVASRC
jgi:3-oxoacyl-[acyl-carrier-protein] synthase II